MYDEPADTFVATFLGSPPMNIVQGDGVIVGFRPEHFLPPGVAERMGEHVSYQFKITHSEYLGAERILYGVMVGGPFNDRKVISRIPATHGAEIVHGNTYTFAVANRDVKYFDSKTEKRK